MPAGEVFDLLARLHEQTAVQDGRATLLAFPRPLICEVPSRRDPDIYFYIYMGSRRLGRRQIDTGYL